MCLTSLNRSINVTCIWLEDRRKNRRQKNLPSYTVPERPPLLWCRAAVVRWFTAQDRRQGPRRRGSDADPVIVISSGDDNDDVLCRYFYSCAKYFSIISRVRTRLLQQGYFLRKKAVAAPPRPLGTVSFCWFWPDIDLLSQLLGYHLFIRTLHEPSWFILFRLKNRIFTSWLYVVSIVSNAPWHSSRPN